MRYSEVGDVLTHRHSYRLNDAFMNTSCGENNPTKPVLTGTHRNEGNLTSLARKGAVPANKETEGRYTRHTTDCRNTVGRSESLLDQQRRLPL